MKNNPHPLAWIGTTYFAMGLPFVVLNVAAVLMYKGLGVSDAKITFWTSLIMLPWSFKPLWSPFMELFGTKKFYVIITQLISGIAFGMTALSLMLHDFFAASVSMLAVVAFSGATHDIAADGAYMSLLDDRRQSQYIGWQGAFYNIAKIVGTGGLVFLAGWLSGHGMTVKLAWMTVMGICGVLMLVLALYNAFAIPATPRSADMPASAGAVWHELVTVIADFFRKPHIIYYIAFIILYRFAEGFVVKIVPLFLKATTADGGLGLTDELIGLYYGTFGAAAFVIGSVLGGYFISHYGLKRTLFTLALIFNLPFAVYALLAVLQPSSGWMIALAIVFEYFGYGFGFVGLTLFMMQQIAPGRHRMAHYAFASAIMNLGVMLPGMMSGWLCQEVGGYRNFFLITLAFIIVPLLITYFVPFTYNSQSSDIAKA